MSDQKANIEKVRERTLASLGLFSPPPSSLLPVAFRSAFI